MVKLFQRHALEREYADSEARWTRRLLLVRQNVGGGKVRLINEQRIDIPMNGNVSSWQLTTLIHFNLNVILFKINYTHGKVSLKKNDRTIIYVFWYFPRVWIDIIEYL